MVLICTPLIGKGVEILITGFFLTKQLGILIFECVVKYGTGVFIKKDERDVTPISDKLIKFRKTTCFIKKVTHPQK